MFNSDSEQARNIAVIKVFGVGGAGNNAVNRMIEEDLQHAELYSVNTDNQQLLVSLSENRIQIGAELTKGLGAGANPEVGEKAAEESKDDIANLIKGSDLVFVAAGMGGGTGTGAAPVVARISKELGCLTVGVVTKPFSYEGRKREENARKGIANLRKYVDALVVIPNDKLLQVVPRGTSFSGALKVADDVLRQGITAITTIISQPSLINLDFADIKAVLKDAGMAHMGIGVGKGDNRLIEAVRQAVSSPLLETTIEGAKAVILYIAGGDDLSLDEVSEAAKLVQGVVDYAANIFVGNAIIPEMKDELSVTIIATGFNSVRAEDVPEASKEELSLASLRQTAPSTPIRPVGAQGYQQPQAQPQPQVQQPQPQQRYERPPVNEQPSDVPSPRETVSRNSETEEEVPGFVRRLWNRKK